MNRGWLNTFRRWGSTAAFRRLWPTLRSAFGSDFVEFCESQLKLTTATLSLMRLSGTANALEGFEQKAFDLLTTEFQREWPNEVLTKRGLDNLLIRASQLKLAEFPAWLIVQAPSGNETAAQAPEAEIVVSGIILLACFPDHPPQPSDLNHDPNPIELFVWVRPPLRTAGLASKCLVREKVHEIQSIVSRPLWVRYADPARDDDDIEFANWVNFFARYDFKRVFQQEDDQAERWNCALLKREWRPGNVGGAAGVGAQAAGQP
jgi:hypothetical protein